MVELSKNTNKQILTLAIPSYNRKEYLKQCLDHVCSQLNEKVKIVVRDNCSTNYDFDTFIAPYVENFGVTPYKNYCNVGGDANFAKLFETCDTKWICILGDDDYLAPCSLSTILNTLEEHKDALYVNFQSRYNGEVMGLEGFAKAMDGMSAFANSFFISVCFHNMEKGSADNFLTYKYLSMKISQIIRVMVHLRNDPMTKCYFTSQEILEKHGWDTCWKHDELIIPLMNMYDVFRNERKILNSNVFRCITGKLMHYISFSDLSFNDKCYYWRMLFFKYGTINVFRYNFKHMLGVIRNIIQNRK